MIIIKNKDSISKMKEAGTLVALVHQKLKEIITPGISLLELDREAEKIIREHGAIPSFKGYEGFPNTICASMDEVVVHGIPSSRRLKEGEIISIDVGALKDGYHGDAAFTAAVGVISPEKEKLISVTEDSFFKGLQMAKVGNRLGDISHAIQKTVESAGFSIVREFVGHGIGEDLHEDPAVPNYGPPGRGPRLEAGMALAIEPMVNMGGSNIEILEDGWTVVTKDKQPSAHYEHTVIITESEPIILTRL
ncbi:type I methionyl aminopeptidase [endosymbiont 'TC1' of Trimyema compressum]|uniref:type I methionyl aminopeptidase n=1 Tax=endosymbiont 'TC1' of Trimyema compressum TaxID=243899 RepID=UPI0007F128D6|nr:type I methionyl aminopeptidase [endosymbiont 'TC1' of Trimyema compressum]AMP20341.1 type I methionyl aminopeptidase [endosymbiont 'TC1' of Trimyema compressum]